MGEVIDDLIAETKAEFAAHDTEVEEALQKSFSVADGASQPGKGLDGERGSKPPASSSPNRSG